MVSLNNTPQPVNAPVPVPSQRTYAVGQEAGVSFGQYNINTNAITSYYEGLSGMLSDGVSLFTNLKKLKR